MYCPNCGERIENNARFCSSCGAPVNPVGEPPNIPFITAPPEEPRYNNGNYYEQKRRKKPGCLISLIGILVFISLVGSCSGNGNKKAQIDSVQKSESKPNASFIETEEITDNQYEILSTRANCWVNSIGTPWVQTIIEIQNTSNNNLYIDSCSYDLEDADGNLIAAHSLVSGYPQIIAPGEKAVIYNETTLDAVIEGEITVIPHEDIEKANADLIRFPVTDFSLSTAKYGDIRMVGRVENTSNEEQSLVYVVANLYNADGLCIGQIFTSPDTIKAGDKVGFDAESFSMPSYITLEDVASYEVFAFPYQFQF